VPIECHTKLTSVPPEVLSEIAEGDLDRRVRVPRTSVEKTDGGIEGDREVEKNTAKRSTARVAQVAGLQQPAKDGEDSLCQGCPWAPLIEDTADLGIRDLSLKSVQEPREFLGWLVREDKQPKHGHYHPRDGV
jgi:hypothetical protein